MTVTLEINGKRVEVENGFLQLSPEAQQQLVEQIAAEIGTQPAQANPIEGAVRALTVKAQEAYAAGDDARGKAFLVEASRLAVDSGMVPEGITADPRTGGMVDLRNMPLPEGTGAALGIGALQGLGFGGGDEVIGAGSAALNAAGLGNGTDGRFATEQAREIERRAQENNPAAYYAGLIPGAVASSVTAGKALGVNPTGASLLGTMGKGAAIGATEGGIWGLLSGEGTEGRIKEGIKSAALGAGVGFAAPAVVKGLSAAGNAVRDLAQGTTGTANRSLANRMMISTLQKSGKSADDVQQALARAAQEGQPEYRVMDALGTAGQRRASGVVRAGGDGAEEVAAFLRQRQLDQPNRVAGFVEDAFDMRGKTAAGTKDSLTAARSAAANTAYDAARTGAVPVDIRNALQVIDDRIGGMQGSGVAGDGIDGLLSRFRSRLASTGGTKVKGSSVELSDFSRVLGVKQDVQDAIGEAVRAGRNNEARELGKLASALDTALEGASDGYRAANDGFRTASRVIDAVDSGAGMARPGARAADTVPAFQAMTPEQQAAARVGYGDRALAKIEASTSPTANVAKAFNSSKAKDEAAAMATDPALFGNRIGRENDMWETMNRALGGSKTADNLQDIAELGPLQNIIGALRSTATGNLGNAASSLGAAAAPLIRGQNEATRKLVANMLLSPNGLAALAPAIAAEASAQGRRRIAEAIVRAVSR